MRKLVLILISLGFFACQSQDSRDTAIQQVVPKKESKGAMQTVAPKKVSQKVVRDSIKPKIANQRFQMDSARPKSKIDNNFPYDIDLKTADGKVVNSSEILKSNGKPTVLLFWLTTCYPCSLEMAAIKKKYESWQKEADFQLFALSTDFEKNYPRFVKMVGEKDWPWPTYNDVNREFRRVMPGGLNGLPQTFLLDKDGKVVYHKRKYRSGDEDQLFEKIKSIAMK